MPRKHKYLIKRAKFVQKTIQNPKWGADQLRFLAMGLDNCKNTSDTVRALEQILFIEERTIFRDLVRD